MDSSLMQRVIEMTGALALIIACQTCGFSVGGNGAVTPAATGPAKIPFTMKTYTYKKVGDEKLDVDVYRADDNQLRPTILYLHGGALIMGGRQFIFPDLRDFCHAEGYCLNTADYRRAPDVRLPQIIEDLRDLIKWVNGKGADLCHSDTTRIAVAGQSAGGYLTMMAGLCEPHPKALVSYWGYGDVDGDWYTQPSEFYRKTQPLVSQEKAYHDMGLPVPGEPPLTTPLPKNPNRGQFYFYLRQNGLWTKVVTGFDPAAEKEKLDPYCPVRNVTAQYPPMLMIHGEQDTDVPCQKSRDMAEELKKHNVPFELITIPGAGHVLANGDKKLIDAAFARAQAFIKKYHSDPISHENLILS